MLIVCAVVSIALAAMAAMSGSMKLSRQPDAVAAITGVGVPLGWFPFLAVAEIAGSAGLLIGLGWAPIGVAAAGGLVAYFFAAGLAHVRAGDYPGIVKPLPVLVLAVVALVLRIVTA
jgi:hypothetical protein